MKFVSFCKDQLTLDSQQVKILTSTWRMFFGKQTSAFWEKTYLDMQLFANSIEM